MMLITVTGSKSGKSFTTPVNYWRLQDEQGEYLATTSLRSRTWWRNLRGGQEVSLFLQGENKPANAMVEEDAAQVEAGMGSLLTAHPRMVRFYQVQLDAAGKLDAVSLAKAAQGMVFIRTRLK